MSAAGPQQGFIRTAAGHVSLFSVPGSSATLVTQMNATGTIVGGYTDSFQQQHGFQRTPDGTITSFDPTGSLLTQPNGVSGKGMICGTFSTAQGIQHAFLGQVQ